MKIKPGVVVTEEMIEARRERGARRLDTLVGMTVIVVMVVLCINSCKTKRTLENLDTDMAKIANVLSSTNTNAVAHE